MSKICRRTKGSGCGIKTAGLNIQIHQCFVHTRVFFQDFVCRRPRDKVLIANGTDIGVVVQRMIVVDDLRVLQVPSAAR